MQRSAVVSQLARGVRPWNRQLSKTVARTTEVNNGRAAIFSASFLGRRMSTTGCPKSSIQSTPSRLTSSKPEVDKESTVWLYEQTNLRVEGHIIGFDEYMNLVLDEAEEGHVNN
ncbi:hypothetical protein LSH36_1201g00052 [Paralvinella palmiformis]|uniref:Sm protein E n=1 Tax=Paralvinella palmiformis TaxID=53620 RepID=A0AAD9MR07_9ANNE|nr:hypothetical protein LSH36_1201g00052 [Paralvinella palmiformis]